MVAKDDTVHPYERETIDFGIRFRQYAAVHIMGHIVQGMMTVDNRSLGPYDLQPAAEWAVKAATELTNQLDATEIGEYEDEKRRRESNGR